jgi:predicted thioesterase
MVALMEGAACEAIAPAIPEDKTTVGIELNIQHTSATPVGLEVRAEAEVTAVEGKIITFSLTAYDEAGKIGEGTHKRCIVSSQRFLDKTYEKL